MMQTNIRKLVAYGLKTGLIEESDKVYTINRLLELFGLDELEDSDEEISMEVEELETVLSVNIEIPICSHGSSPE